MAQLNKTDLEGKYNHASTGLFKDNTARAIGADDVRALVEDEADSIPFTLDDSYTWPFPRVDITGTTAYTGTLSPAITAYTNGMKVHVKAKDTSTGGVTLNLNAVAVKQVWKNPTTQAGANDLLDEQDYILAYDSALNGGAGVFLMIAGGGAGGTWGGIIGTLSDQTDLNTALGLKAPLDSPTFTGTPAAPTAAPGTNNTQVASTAYADAAVAAALSAAKSMVIAVTDEVTNIGTGTGKVSFRMPYAMTLTAVRASLVVAQASGSIFTVDINESGSSILSTKLTIDNTETTSVTAATPPVISDTALADDAVITVDVDQIGNGSAIGLKITLIGT